MYQTTPRNSLLQTEPITQYINADANPNSETHFTVIGQRMHQTKQRNVNGAGTVLPNFTSSSFTTFLETCIELPESFAKRHTTTGPLMRAPGLASRVSRTRVTTLLSKVGGGISSFTSSSCPRGISSFTSFICPTGRISSFAKGTGQAAPAEETEAQSEIRYARIHRYRSGR